MLNLSRFFNVVMHPSFTISCSNCHLFTNVRSYASKRDLYVQGQYQKKNIREYFYFIDHQGQLFLDDTKVKNFITCFKEKQFLEFFFRRLRRNNTGRYEHEFPFLSLCGRERNFISGHGWLIWESYENFTHLTIGEHIEITCDDYPVVYSHIIEKEKGDIVDYFLSYGGVGDKLTIPFEPQKLCMLPHSGRVYHTAPERFGGIGLIKSSLAIEISPGFIYDKCNSSMEDNEKSDLPKRFVWRGHNYQLTNELCDKVLL